MSISTVTLNKFIKPVPEVTVESNWQSVLSCFRSSEEEEIIVVNEKRSPQGIIYSRRLISQIMNNQFLLKDLNIVIEAVTILSAEMSLKKFYSYLQTSRSQEKTYILIDSQGKSLGLLDYAKLMKSVSWQLSDNILFELIEQLPIPLMLKTEEGETLSQNIAWHKQLGVFHPNNSVIEVKEQVYQNSKSLVEFLPETTNVIQPECLKDSHYLASVLFQSQLQELVPELFDFQDNYPAKSSQVVCETPLPKSPPISFEEENIHEEELFCLSPEKVTTIHDRTWKFAKILLSVPSPLGNIWLIIATDITQQQRLCKELGVKNADLVQLNRFKDEFLACITHELKSPLTAIVGLSSLLKDQKLGELNQRQGRYAELIYHSGRQLMTLVNDLLDLTHLETGQLQLNLEPVQIKRVCQRAYESLKEKHKEKIDEQVEFSLEVEKGLETLIADEMRLRQMLIHLLDNAVKFSEYKGQIGLRVNIWEKWIAFTVWDTGIGIPSEAQYLIFQKFQQLESPLTRKFAGTGLGLALTQRLAKIHGGDISFISKENSGSEFTILLPSGLSRKNNDVSFVSSQLVLIVEAVPLYIENVSKYLEELGLRFVIARTGVEALEKARQLQPSMILLNPLLPLLSGWDVLSLLKLDPKTKHIRVIITSESKDKPQAEAHGSKGFLTLPVEKQSLEEIINYQNPFLVVDNKSLTILHLCPNPEKINFNSQFNLGREMQLSGLKHRVLEADDLEQADLLAHFWKIDALLFDGGSLSDPVDYLRSLSEHDKLASLPFITCDSQITEFANLVGGLSVFPCLVPFNKDSINDLLQVIKIASGIGI